MANVIVLVFSLVFFLAVPFQCYSSTSFITIDQFRIRDLLLRRRNSDAVGPLSFDFHVSAAAFHGTKENDKIESLPGQPGVAFNQYSGYVTVDINAGQALFYYFVESPQNSSSKPLVLWLNGGPGCSSLGAGAFTELGPFRVNKDGKTLYRNQYSWNQEANIIFLESPAGVGFSYSNTSSDYDLTGDTRTAHDAYAFLINWLERFPEYKTRDFYIAGESYAGHYVPQLANLIVLNNEYRNQTTINLKGITMGNAEIDSDAYPRGSIDYYWTHALASDELYLELLSNCNFSTSGNFSLECVEYFQQMIYGIGNIDAYNIYAPICNSTSASVSIRFDPCSLDYVDNYLNIPQVQIALHANDAALPHPWQLCNFTLNQNWKDSLDTELPIIKGLMERGIRVWIYSGDIDAVVSITTTKYAIKKLGLPMKIPWYPWYLQDEVGGFVVEYQNLTFVTIRGSGHLVPSHQPERALAFFSSFLNNRLPASV